jgi:hypothetical protein
MKKPHDEDAAEAETRAMLVDCRALLSDDHFVYISGTMAVGGSTRIRFLLSRNEWRGLVSCRLMRCGGLMRRFFVGQPRVD